MKKNLFMALVCLMTMITLASSGSNYSNSKLVRSDVCYAKAKQCVAMTKKGTRCKRNAEKGSIYCWQHKKNN